MSLWFAIVGTAITALAALAGVIWTARASIAAARESARAAPYEVLAKRVDILEKQVATLQHERSIDREHIRDLHASVEGDRPIPKPPAWYYGDGDDQVSI